MNAAGLLLYGVDHMGNEVSKNTDLVRSEIHVLPTLEELVIFTVRRFTFIRSSAG